MKAKYINFTKKGIEALPIPTKEEGVQIYYDTGTKDGLSLRVTYGGTKTYYFSMFFQGRPVQFKIGRTTDISHEDARKKAHAFREQGVNEKKDPSAERRADLNDITLKQFYETFYKPEYSFVYKKQGSINNDDSIFRHRLKDLQHRRLLSIRPDEIERLHNKLKKELTPYSANRMLSLIKHMYSIAIKRGFIPNRENPAESVRKFPEPSRDRFLQSDEMKRFFEALATEDNQVFKNYVLLSLFTGARRSSILTMRWDNVDLQNGFIYLPDTKNGEPMRIPLTTQLKDLLQEIKATAENDWVLPSKKSSSGHLEDPKRPWQDLLARAGIENLRLHDLRRTQGSYQAITGASLHIVGRSLGHKSASATQVYARLTTDPIKESMQKATDRMMELVGK